MLMDFLHCSCSLFSTVKLLIILVSFSDDWIYYINYFKTQKKKNANEKIKPFFVYENDNLAYLHLFVWTANIAWKIQDIIMFRTQNCMWDLKCTYFVFIETIGLGFSKRGE